MTNLDHYRQAVELSLDCVLELDFNRCITSVNAAGCRILRATAPEELIGKPWESLWTPSTLDCARLALDRVFGGDATQFSGTAQAIDGGELQWYVTAIPARDGKRSIDSVIVVCRDLTERIHFETALEAVNLALTERLGLAKTASAAAQRREATLRDRLDIAARAQELAERVAQQAQKAEAIGQVVAGIAHDFNNMLQATIAGLSAVCDEPERLDARQQRLLGLSMEGALHAATLVRRLMAFSRKHRFDPEELELGDAVEDMAGLIQLSVGDSMTVRFEPGDGHFPVIADKHCLEQALMNLCINARDASGGRGVITVALTSHRLEKEDASALRIAGNYAALSVTDHGSGIDEGSLAHLFEPFFTTKGDDVGTGLGLAQAHSFMRQSGGFIDVESTLGEGTTMRLMFPLALVVANE